MKLGSLIDRWTGQGDAAITIPAMDGALRPNSRLDALQTLARIPAVDNLAWVAGRLHLSSRGSLLAIDEGASAARLLEEFESDVVALASNGSGLLAVGLDDGSIALREPGGHGPKRFQLPSTGGARSPAALMFSADDEQLIVAVGSANHRASEWKRDLMSLGRSGSVWKLDLRTETWERLAQDLAYPCGVAADGSGRLVISEAWSHSLVVLDGARRRVVLEDLPGYPGRVVRASDGGYWLPIFAPRSQMVEFVLRERVFCDRMIETIPPEHWMAPALRARSSFLEPLQGGAVKHLGIDKPWSPTRSYGLLVKLDAEFHPVYSLHSRADGRRHGITSCAERAGRLVIASQGNDELLHMNLEGAQRG